MSDLKRYWIVIHSETELMAETEWDGYFNTLDDLSASARGMKKGGSCRLK